MKRYLFMAFVVLFAYVPFLFAFCNQNIRMILFVGILLFLLALTAVLVNVVLTIKNRQQAKSLALTGMLIKLLHVPAYVCLFIIGMGGAMLVKFLPVTFAIFLFDCVLIFFSGMIMLSAVICAVKEKKLEAGQALFFGITSFIFCIDVISVILLYCNIKGKKEIV